MIGSEHLLNLILETPFWVLLIALVGTGINYLILSGYDVLALQYIGKSLSYLTILKAAWTSFAVSNTTGHIYAAGGAVRYLFYVPDGLGRLEILKMIVFETLTVFLGMAAAFELSVAMIPFEPILRNYAGLNTLYLMAIVILFILGWYYVFSSRKRRLVHFGKRAFYLPNRTVMGWQIFVGLADNLTLFFVFYVLLQYHLNTPLGGTLTIFVIAQSIGMVTQVPGGIGVFEGTFLCLFPHTVAQKGAILGSLILFRVLYYFVPFIIATLCLGIRELYRFGKTKFPSSI